MDMKKYSIILLVLFVALCSVAQQPSDSIANDICRFAKQQDALSVEEVADVTRRWVDAIPQEDLLAYAAQASKVLYPVYSTHKGRMAYRVLLERLLQSGGDEWALMRYKYMYESLSRNNEGEEACDFVYYDKEGNEHTLYSHKGSKTLVIFNDPECEECAALCRHIATAGELCGEVIDSTTHVLLIYPDEPTDAWRKAVSRYPDTWFVGYAQDVSDLYDLRTLPSTYLLDASHHILLRDEHLYITERE